MKIKIHKKKDKIIFDFEENKIICYYIFEELIKNKDFTVNLKTFNENYSLILYEIEKEESFKDKILKIIKEIPF